MAKTAKRKSAHLKTLKKKIATTPYTFKSTNFSMANMLNALNPIEQSIVRRAIKQSRKRNNGNISMNRRRSSRVSLPVSRYVPAASSRRTTQKKKNTQKNTQKNKTETIQPPLNTIMEEVIVQEPVVEAKTRKERTIRAKQLGVIVGKNPNKYPHLESIKKYYNAHKNKYGFNRETNIKNIEKIMKQQPAINMMQQPAENVNELAALLGEFELGPPNNNNNL